jgi:hypothetical protein
MIFGKLLFGFEHAGGGPEPAFDEGLRLGVAVAPRAGA